MYVLRKATYADNDIAYQIKRSALKEYVEKTWGWTEDFQRDYHKMHFSPVNMHMIEAEGKPVGLIKRSRRKNFIFIEDLYLIPAWQNKGIGSHIMRSIQDECRQSGKMIRLEVLDKNQKGIAFYKRHGFVITGKKPEKKVMEWSEATDQHSRRSGCLRS